MLTTDGRTKPEKGESSVLKCGCSKKEKVSFCFFVLNSVKKEIPAGIFGFPETLDNDPPHYRSFLLVLGLSEGTLVCVPDGSGSVSGLSVLTRNLPCKQKSYACCAPRRARGGDIESLEELVTLMRRIGWNAKRSYVTLATFGLRSTTPTLMLAAVREGPFFTSA